MEPIRQEPDVKLHELLKKLIELNGSDLHLTNGTPPQVRIDGELRPLDGYPPLGRDDTQRLVYSVLSNAPKGEVSRRFRVWTSHSESSMSHDSASMFSTDEWDWCVFRAISVFKSNPLTNSDCHPVRLKTYAGNRVARAGHRPNGIR